MCHNIIVGFGSRFVVKISKNIDDKKLSNIFFIASRQDSFKKNETTVSNGHHFYDQRDRI